MKCSKKSADIVFILIVLCYLVWGVGFIVSSSCVVEGERYFCLFDDAMVSMRYADNLADGHGLVWNRGGDKVEGFTNPLWTMVMALSHLLPIAASKVSLLVQLLGLGLLTANLFVVRRLADEVSGQPACGLGAVFLTGFYLGINTWGLLGMETSVLTLILSLSALSAVRARRGDTPNRIVFVLLAVGVLVRPDMAVTYGAFWLAWAALAGGSRKSDLLFGAALLAGVVAGCTAIRFAYYGEILPNTYYLKLGGIPLIARLWRGLATTLDFVLNMGVVPFLVVIAVAVLGRANRGYLLLGWIFAVQIAYSVYVGGDAWEDTGYANRYISVAMPCFFVLLAVGLGRGVLLVVGNNHTGPRAPHPGPLPLGEGGEREDPHPSPLPGGEGGDAGRRHATACVLYVLLVLACWIAVHDPFPKWHIREFARQMTFRVKPFTAGFNERNIVLALRLRSAAPDATVAVTWAGAIPYFSGLQAIDVWGKCDKRIARMSVPGLDRREFRPGHSKCDFGYSIHELKPDVIALTRREDNEPGLVADYRAVDVPGHGLVYVRRDSDKVDVGKLTE